jgi:hypothetical protein
LALKILLDQFPNLPTALPAALIESQAALAMYEYFPC